MKNVFDETLDHRKDFSYRWQQPEGRNDVIGMGTADLDFHCPPCVKNACLKVAEENTYNYRYKTDKYFDAVTGWYDRVYDLKVKKEWLSNVPSTIGSIRLLLGIFAKPGDSVLLQSPYFGPVMNAVDGAGCKTVLNRMILKDGRYELDLDDFEAKIKTEHPAIYIIINPHNPTGRIFTKEEMVKMVDICADNGVRIISDEVHGHIVYENLRHTPILAVSDAARKIAIQVVSISKGYNLMSLPHSIVTIADQDMRDIWNRYLSPFGFHFASNSYAIAAVTAALGGEADEWLCELKQYLMKNRNEMFEYLKNNFPVTPLKPEAGFLMWVDCRNSGLDTKDLRHVFLSQAGIDLDDGTEFGPDGEGFVRVNYAVTNANLKLALKRMHILFDKGGLGGRTSDI